MSQEEKGSHWENAEHKFSLRIFLFFLFFKYFFFFFLFFFLNFPRHKSFGNESRNSRFSCFSSFLGGFLIPFAFSQSLQLTHHSLVPSPASPLPPFPSLLPPFPSLSFFFSVYHSPVRLLSI